MVLDARALLMLLWTAAVAAEETQDLPPGTDPARVAFRRGNYEEALKSYEPRMAQPERSSATMILEYTDLLMEVGRYEDAEKVCIGHLEKHTDEITPRIRLGDVLLARGKLAEAEQAFRSALEASPASVDAQLGLAQAHRARGRRQEAGAILSKLADSYYVQRPTDPESLLSFGHVFEAIQRPHQALDLFVQAARHLADPTEAILATASLFLDKGQINDAAREFRSILKKNPKNPFARQGMAACHFRDGTFPKVTGECEAALQVNPNLLGALELLAALSILEEDYAAAEERLGRGLRVNPNALPLRTLLATCHYLRLDQAKYEQERDAILAIDPNCAEFYRSIGEAAERLRRRKVAREFYEKAYEMAPESWEVLASLGFLLCREGDEKTAYARLEKSFELNRFSVRVYNLLQTLDYMGEFVAEEADEFVVKVHRKQDACLSRYAFQYLREAHSLMSLRYAYTPVEKVLVELFPRHDLFAARVHGLPSIDLNGVCFGRVIVSDSPRVHPGTFNWRDILVHELSHVFTLQATDYQIPRWLTEGLASFDEGRPRTVDQDRLLSAARRKGEFIPLSGLNRAFTRPRSPSHHALAYIQSEMATEFILRTFGSSILPKILRGFREGATADDVFRKCLEMSLAELDEKVQLYLTREADQVPVLPVFQPEDIDGLREAVRRSPADARTRAYLALACLQCGRRDAAQAEVELALKHDANLALACLIVGDLQMEQGKRDPARTQYQKAVERDPSLLEAHYRLAVIAGKDGLPAEGIQHARKAVELCDRFGPAYTALENLAEQANDAGLRLDALEGMLKCPNTLPAAVQKLSLVYSRLGRHKDLERVAQALFEMNPYVVDVHAALAQSYEAQNQLLPAQAEYLTCIQIEPSNADHPLRLAQVFLKGGRKEEARKVLTEALEINPKREDLRACLDSLK